MAENVRPGSVLRKSALEDRITRIQAVSMSLVVTLTCIRCCAQVSVIGPSTAPTPDVPGWQISERDFYRSGGMHYCPQHQTRLWLAWCGESDCWVSGPGNSDVVVAAPASLGRDGLADQLRTSTCRSGHELVDFEPWGGPTNAPVDIELGR